MSPSTLVLMLFFLQAVADISVVEYEVDATAAFHTGTRSLSLLQSTEQKKTHVGRKAFVHIGDHAENENDEGSRKYQAHEVHDTIEMLRSSIASYIRSLGQEELPKNNTLGMLQSMFDIVLQDLLSEHQSDQTSMTAQQDAGKNCSHVWKQLEDNKQNVSAQRALHKQCRIHEVVAANAQTKACANMRSTVSNAQGNKTTFTLVDCISAAPNITSEDGGASMMLSCLQQARTWADVFLQPMNSSRSDCNQKTAQSAAQATECDKTQMQFESLSCQQAVVHDDVCIQQGLCRALAVSYNQTIFREEHRKNVGHCYAG